MGHWCTACGYIDKYMDSGVCKTCYEKLYKEILDHVSTTPAIKDIMIKIAQLGTGFAQDVLDELKIDY
jgi:hypothetical protein